MARTTVENVNFIGDGNATSVSLYFKLDIQAALSQNHAEALQPVNVEVKTEITNGFESVPAGTRVTALIAVDAQSDQLKNSNHIVVLPCPPYCHK